VVQHVDDAWLDGTWCVHLFMFPCEKHRENESVSCQQASRARSGLTQMCTHMQIDASIFQKSALLRGFALFTSHLQAVGKIPSAWARGGVSPELPRTTGAQPNQGDF